MKLADVFSKLVYQLLLAIFVSNASKVSDWYWPFPSIMYSVSDQ